MDFETLIDDTREQIANYTGADEVDVSAFDDRVSIDLRWQTEDGPRGKTAAAFEEYERIVEANEKASNIYAGADGDGYYINIVYEPTVYESESEGSDD